MADVAVGQAANKEEGGGGQRGWMSTRLERRRTGMGDGEGGVRGMTSNMGRIISKRRRSSSGFYVSIDTATSLIYQ